MCRESLPLRMRGFDTFFCRKSVGLPPACAGVTPTKAYMRLDGKIAIVTGAASGFGRGIAETFAREGAHVVIADLNTEGAAEVANSIGKAAVPFTCDVSKKADVDAMVHAAVKAFGGLDILVNNAGVTHKNQSLMTVSEDDFDRIYAVNVKSIYLTTLAAVPEMENTTQLRKSKVSSKAGLLIWKASFPMHS